MKTIKKFNRLGGVPKTTPLKGIKSTEAFPRQTFRLQRRRRIVRPSVVGIKPPYIFDLGGTRPQIRKLTERAVAQGFATTTDTPRDLGVWWNDPEPRQAEVLLVYSWLDNWTKNAKTNYGSSSIPALGDSPHYLRMQINPNQLIFLQVALTEIAGEPETYLPSNLEPLNIKHASEGQTCLIRFIFGQQELDEKEYISFAPIFLSILATLADFHTEKGGETRYSVDSFSESGDHDFCLAEVHDCFYFLTESHEGAWFLGRIFFSVAELIKWSGRPDLLVGVTKAA
jgi:hypothetical protein